MSIIPPPADAGKRKIDRYAMHKRMARPVAEMLREIGEEGRAARMNDCASRLIVRHCPKCGHVHVMGGNLCRDRLCPVCSWRTSVRRYAEMATVMDRLWKEGALDGLKIGMLTLTVRNCDPAALSETIDLMMDGFKRFQQRKPIRLQIAGWARTLEITYNAAAGTFHPHIHLMLLWHPAIGKPFSWAGVAHEWETSCRLGYAPVWDYRDAYSSTGADGWDEIMAAVAECSKYVTKAAEYVSVGQDGTAESSMPLAHFRQLVRAIKGRRLAGYGGLIADMRREIGLEDDDEAQQEEDRIKCPDCGAQMGETILEWAGVGAQSGYIPAASSYIVR